MKIYCSGIGGIGLSAYAALQASNGHTVLGSDRSDSALLDDMRSQGITVFLNQDGSCVPSDCDLFVYSEAVPADAPERIRAREFGINSQSYFHALGELSRPSFVIAVCGTHGKSSTTAMTAKVLLDAERDPTVVVGTKMKELDGRNWRKGESELFVVEACEYRRSFHYISPDIVLMTNVDGDHFDAFSSVEDYQEAFVTFLKRLPQDGIVIVHGKDQASMNVAIASGKTIIDADVFIVDQLGVPGAHMKENARLTYALAHHVNIDEKIIRDSLAGFKGTWRRMEHKGDLPNNISIIDDYGHHPAEIRATLNAMREAYPTRRIVCVFQPHTHDRTIKLYDDVTSSFKDADLVIITDIYNARSEIETQEVNVDALIRDISIGSMTATLNGNGMQSTLNLVKERMQPNDVIVVMGAGDIAKLAEQLLEA